MHPALFRSFEFDDQFDLALQPTAGASRVLQTHAPPTYTKACAPRLSARATTSQVVLDALWQQCNAMTLREIAQTLPDLTSHAIGNALFWLNRHGYVKHLDAETARMPCHWRVTR